MRTIQSIILKEWETIELTRYNNEMLEALVDFQERRIIQLKPTSNGILVSSNSMVGFEKNDAVSLVIEPKIPKLSFVKMIGYVCGYLHSSEMNIALLGNSGTSYLELVILQWLEMVERLSNQMRKKYTTIRSKETYIKGKINVKEFVKQGMVLEKNPIAYQTLQLNQPLNQVLKYGLMYFKNVSRSAFVHNKIDLLLRSFTTISDGRFSLKTIRMFIFKLSRLEEAYRNPLEYLCWLLEATGIEQGQNTGKSMWVNMNSLFQNYLTKVFDNVISEYRFVPEVSDRTIFMYDQNYNPFHKAAVSIRPDLLVFKGNSLYSIIDFKYKNLIENTISTTDLYQLSNYGLSIGKGLINPIILYPSVTEVPEQKILVGIRVTEKPQRISIRGVNLLKIENYIDEGSHQLLRDLLIRLIEE